MQNVICCPFLILYFDINITVGWFASDPSMLHRVGHALLRLSPLEPKRTRHIIIADDLFQLSKVPLHKTVSVVSKAIEKLSGCKFLHHLYYKYILFLLQLSLLIGKRIFLNICTSPLSLYLFFMLQMGNLNIFNLVSSLHQMSRAWNSSLKNRQTSKLQLH